MRVVDASGYVEPRDALAHDWSEFFDRHMPDIQWLAIPNLGEDVISYVNNWELDGFVLTGGDDLGVYPLRDLTEQTILELSIQQHKPVFGVCHGMQLICSYFGAMLEKQENHVNIHHRVTLQSVSSWHVNDMLSVNSFHTLSVPQSSLPSSLLPVAIDSEGMVEAFIHDGLPVGGVMWHPERKGPDSMNQFDVSFMRKILGVAV